MQLSIKYLDDYEGKEDAKGTVWLSEEVLRETTGIDSRGNPHLNLIKVLNVFLNVKQGQDKSNDFYLKRSKVSMDALRIAGGSHVFTSPDLIKIGGSTLTNREK